MGLWSKRLMKILYGWFSLVQYISSDQRILFQCTQRVHFERTLKSSLWAYLRLHFLFAINEGLSSKFFTRNQIKICGHAAKYLCIFYLKVSIWCDMIKGLEALFWMHSRSKLIEWSYRKATVNGYNFNHWSTHFHFFLIGKTLSKQR